MTALEDGLKTPPQLNPDKSSRQVYAKDVNKTTGGQKKDPVTSSAIQQGDSGFSESSDLSLQRLSGNNRESEGWEGNSSSEPEICLTDWAEVQKQILDSAHPMWIIPCFQNSEGDDEVIQIRVNNKTLDEALFARFRREYFTIFS